MPDPFAVLVFIDHRPDADGNEGETEDDGEDGFHIFFMQVGQNLKVPSPSLPM